MSKYNNVKIVIDGIKFDSRAESKRYSQLKLLERLGGIQNLETQKKFSIIPKSKYGAARYYIADFCYIENGAMIVEDVKSKATKTAVYSLKKRLMQEVHNIKIQEIYM